MSNQRYAPFPRTSLALLHRDIPRFLQIPFEVHARAPSKESPIAFAHTYIHAFRSAAALGELPSDIIFRGNDESALARSLGEQ